MHASLMVHKLKSTEQREPHIDVPGHGKDAGELGALAESESNLADWRQVQLVAAVDPELADRVRLHQPDPENSAA